MTRLYQWLQERATFFRSESRDSETRRTVRTQVTVEEQQRIMLLTVPGRDGLCVCPLCGHPVSPLSGETPGGVALKHSQVHARCPGPEQIEQELHPRLGKPGDIRRLR